MRVLILLPFFLHSFSLFSQNWTNLITGSEGDDIPQAVATDKYGNTYTLMSESGVNNYDMGDTIIQEEYRCVLCKHAPDGERLWIETPKKCPYQGIDNDPVMFLAVDDSSDIYMAGLFIDSIWFDNASLSFPPPTGNPYAKMFIAKYNDDGEALWAKCADTSFVNFDSYVLDMAIGPDEKLYLLGRSDGPFGMDGISIEGGSFVLILNSDGSIDHLSNLSITVDQLEVDTIGNYYVSKKYETYIYKYDDNHNQVYEKHYDPANRQILKIRIGPDNLLYASLADPTYGGPYVVHSIERLTNILETGFIYNSIYGFIRNILFSGTDLIAVGNYFFDLNYAPVLFQKFDYAGNYLGHKYEFVRLDTNEMSVIRDVLTASSDTGYISLFAMASVEPSGVLFAGDTLYPVSTPGIWGYPLTSRFLLDSLSLEIPVAIQTLNTPDIKLSLYPNPVHTEITISGYTPAYIKLNNIHGQLLSEAVNTTKIDLSTLANGIYFLQLFDKNNALIKTEKVVKE
jgi:hypothetical protein